MSLPDPVKRARRPILAIAMAALMAVAGCTVQPLYGAGVVTFNSNAAPTSGRLASIAISDPVSRPGQEVRNHLIFLFGGGRGEPANPVYRMQLNVSTRTIGAAVVQVGSTAYEPTSSVVSVNASYTVTEIATNRVVARGSRAANAGFDFPRQLYAARRAERDAENRAAREAAELVRLAVGQQMSRLD